MLTISLRRIADDFWWPLWHGDVMAVMAQIRMDLKMRVKAMFNSVSVMAMLNSINVYMFNCKQNNTENIV